MSRAGVGVAPMDLAVVRSGSHCATAYHSFPGPPTDGANKKAVWVPLLASPCRILESSGRSGSPHGAGETKELIGFVFAKSILYEPIPVISINYTTYTHYSYSNTIIDSLDLGGLSRPQNNGGQPIQEMHNTSLHAKGASRWAILTTPFRDRCAIRLPASNKMRRCSRIVGA